MAPAILTLIAVALFMGALCFIVHAKTARDPDAELGLIAYGVISVGAFAEFAIATRSGADPDLLYGVLTMFFTASMATILRFCPWPKPIQPC